jgi:hypothetical protein
MRITINPRGINNFHNSAPLAVRITGETVYAGEDVVYRISKRQAAKIEKHFCGITDCRCPRGGVVVELDQEGETFGLRAIGENHEK